MRAFLCYNKDAKKRRTVQCTDKPKSKQKEKRSNVQITYRFQINKGERSNVQLTFPHATKTSR